MKHIAYNAIASTLFLGLIITASAQSQSGSSTPNGNSNSAASSSSGQALGDYARQIRKTTAPPARPKVFDNDNLPKDDKLSVVGTPREASAAAPVGPSGDTAAAAATSAPAAAGDAKAQPPSDGKALPLTAATAEQEDAARQAAIKQWGEKISAQKDQIDLLTRELDVLQREYQIRAAAMYADVGNRLRNSADWDKQDADYKQRIADKQKALDDAKQKLDDVQEEARKAGVPASVREP